MPHPQVIRRHVSGGAENVESTTINVFCHDSRSFQLVFVMSPEYRNGVLVVKPNEQPLPVKILKVGVV